jgi:ParB/RepB/Spo0J family partition protein
MSESRQVSPDRVESSVFKPRSAMDDQKLRELSKSIRRLGLVQAVLLRPKGDGFEIVVGSRRIAAARRAGLDKIPAVVRDLSDREALEMILAENLQREEMTDVDRGRLCKMLLERFHDEYANVDHIAEKLGYSRSEVQNWIKLVEETPKEVQQLIAAPVQGPRGIGMPRGKISGDVALSIVRRIKEPQKQITVAKRLAQRPVPVRMARQIIKEVARKPERPVEQVIDRIMEQAPPIPFSMHHADLILKEKKTQTSRKVLDPRWKEEAIVPASITHFADLRILAISRKKLGDFTDEDADREGGYDLDEFKKVWIGLHGEWNPNESVSVIRFKLHKMV